ncbi:MAG: mannose-1-phosphate guanylyltransferase [Planctomycetota bacterium]
MANLHAVIMAGGSGTRFWPASRRLRPKQFLPLVAGKPLLQATLDRVAGLVPTARTWIVTNADLARQLAKVVPAFPRRQVLVEPEARDTAPCVALATAHIAARDPKATMLVMPADHVIPDTKAFHRLVRRGAKLAADGRTLVTFGIKPTHPATGYGYLETGARLDATAPAAFAARRFREKPDLATARRFLKKGGFLWNSGIFVWTTDALRQAMAQANPALAAGTEAMLAAARAGRTQALTRAFRALPRTSIDYGVMELAAHVAVVAADLRWDDVGSFPALTAVGVTDANGNVHVLGAGSTALSLASRDNVAYAEGKRTLALFGVHDLVVVAVDDVVMVCPKDQAANLKELVEHARRHGREDLL